MSSSIRTRTTTPQPLDWLDRTDAHTWHAPGSQKLLEAYTGNGDGAGWEVLAEHLETRCGRPPLAKLLPGGERALLWMMPDALVATETVKWVTKLGALKSDAKARKARSLAEATANWLDAASASSESVAHAYECLAWAYALPRLVPCIGEGLWWKLVSHLATIVREAGQTATVHDPLLGQLLGCELPLALAYTLPELQFSHELPLGARARLSTVLDELLDAEGMPRGSSLTSFPAIMASWTRFRAVAEPLGWQPCLEPAARRYEAALVNLARLDGVDPQFFRACLAFDLEKPARQLLRALAKGKVGRKQCQQRGQLPLPAFHSEASQIAALRPTWASKAPRLDVRYGNRAVHVQLDQSGERILSGEWNLTITRNEQACQIASDWECVCWYSDEDVDFLELEASFGDGLRAQRQMLLARNEEVLLLADALLLDESAHLQYRSSLPVGDGINFCGASETREGRLVGQKARALVLPLALPEWQSDRRRGTLEMTAGGLSLTQVHEGRAAYAPLLIDLNAKRARKEGTWRQLTVAEWRQPQANDVAVGYRGQVSDCNWLVYRSLVGDGIRSLLGQQVKAEFLFGRMKPDGDCARLLEIESIEA